MILNVLTKNVQRMRVGHSEVVCLPADDYDEIINQFYKLYHEKNPPTPRQTIEVEPTNKRDPNSLLNIKEAAALLSVGKSTMWSYLKHENAPKPVKIGRSTRYRYSDLLDFIALKSLSKAV